PRTAPGVRLAEKHRRSTTPPKELPDGAFVGDEFVHDPGLWGYAQAATPNDLAIRFADNLSSAGNANFLAMTRHRIGVLVETAHLESEQSEPVSKTPSDDKGFSLLGAAKFAVRSKSSLGGEKPTNPVRAVMMLLERELRDHAGGHGAKQQTGALLALVDRRRRHHTVRDAPTPASSPIRFA